MGYNIGFDDLLNVPTMGGYGAVKAATGGRSLLGRAGDAVSDAASDGPLNDYLNIGQNRFTPKQGDFTPFNVQQQYIGGQIGGDVRFANQGLDKMNDASGRSGQAFDYMMGHGPAVENGYLSRNSNQSRNSQLDALSLQRDAAMGNAPSQAQIQMRQGLDQSLANQQAIAGGARGAGALALAGGNAAANSANMQTQTNNNMGALRAQEMAQARSAYGGMANDLRGQDINRLNTSNQMGLGANQFYTGVGNVGAQYGNTGLGFYGQAGNVLGEQLRGSVAQEGQRVNAYGGAQNNYTSALNTGNTVMGQIATGNAETKAGQTNKIYDTLIGLGKTAASRGAA